MKSKFTSVFKANMELEMIQVDRYGAKSGLFRHFLLFHHLLMKRKISLPEI